MKILSLLALIMCGSLISHTCRNKEWLHFWCYIILTIIIVMMRSMLFIGG